MDPYETAKLQGPSLYRIMGRPAAAIPGFAYSDAMRARGAAGLVWDATTLEHYIADPESVVAGTSMSAPPLRDEQERTDLIAYLALSGRWSKGQRGRMACAPPNGRHHNCGKGYARQPIRCPQICPKSEVH